MLSTQIIKRVNRLRVFQEVRAAMIRDGACPTSHAVAEKLGMDKGVVAKHFIALQHADGLPFPIPSGRVRTSLRNVERLEAGFSRELTAAAMSARGVADPGSPVEVDLLLNMGDRA